MAAKRYHHLYRERPSGRQRKRLLARARKCALCAAPLGADRGLFRGYTGMMEFELLAAHPACPEAYLEQKRAQDAAAAERRQDLSARWAAESRVRQSLIVVDFGPPRVHPA